MSGWAPPRVLSVSPLRVIAGTLTVATLEGCYMHSSEVHVKTNGTLLDGATVRLFAVADDIESLVAEAVIGAATLETVQSGVTVLHRQGIIVSASNILARAWRVTIEAAAGSSDAGQLTASGWGQ